MIHHEPIRLVEGNINNNENNISQIPLIITSSIRQGSHGGIIRK